MTVDDSISWQRSGDYADIWYDTTADGIAKITINRPEVHNAFRPQTLIEVSDALTRMDVGSERIDDTKAFLDKSEASGVSDHCPVTVRFSTLEPDND